MKRSSHADSEARRESARADTGLTRWQLARRLTWIGWIVARSLFVLAWRWVTGDRLSQEEKHQIAGEVMAHALESLGATFVKFGQILSTRPDLFPPSFIEPLSRLQDQLPAAPFEIVQSVLDSEWGAEWHLRVPWVCPTPIAAASVAQVHEARLATGERIAIKVQRPAARPQIERDLALLEIVAGLVDRIPTVRMLSIPGAVSRFQLAMHQQLDFVQEAQNNRRFARAFATNPRVHVPDLYPELCTPRVLAMELIEGVRATEPERVGGDRKTLAAVGMDAILEMVFVNGFVHADLHPGNIILTDDSRVVLIDLGLVAEIDADLLRPYCETFLALASQNGIRAAELFYTYAPRVDTRDYVAYQADVVAHFDTLAGKTLGEVETSEILGGIMAILRRHHVQMDPAFTVVHIALVVAEGLGKQLDSSIDPVQMAVPYLMRTLASPIAGRAPVRQVPGRV